jgi:hypothetical protein
MGSSGEVDRLIAQMKTAGVPCFVSSASPARNRQLAKLCTVDLKTFK